MPTTLPLRKQLWLLAGGNGAGKSTFYRTALQPRGMALVNADNIARDMAPDSAEEASYAAAQLAEHLRYDLLNKGDRIFSSIQNRLYRPGQNLGV